MSSILKRINGVLRKVITRQIFTVNKIISSVNYEKDLEIELLMKSISDKFLSERFFYSVFLRVHNKNWSQKEISVGPL